ncbi:MAG: CDP-diacylglycerol--glycerol-3-phosphate 3-phosphatidyltransferase [Pseudomonadota bacterium]
MNIPNALTLLRVLLIPALVLVFYWPFKWHFLVATLIFILAAITDWLDGYLARKWDQSTPFGEFLDPVADKLMVSVALVLLVELHASPWFAVPACIIISREILVSALREWMADLGKRTSVAVSYVGKVKTGFQMTAIGVFLAAGEHLVPELAYIGYVLLYAAAILTIWSMFVYLRAAAPELRLEK